ncbi:ubiquitin-like protein Pup [Streptomyces sp. NPDC058583]|uniref:ubiquitin-like protein Pup n=1 Tax=unclassified Streptomyces TaxID=2593676 RepID=UPI00365F2A4C
MSRESAGQKRKTSHDDSDIDTPIESAEEPKRLRISKEETNDVLKEVDDVLNEIENPQEWVEQFVQKGGE